MKNLCFVAIILILISCQGEKRHVALVYSILEKPNKIDSICIANGYGIDIRNRNSYIDCLILYPDMKFSSIRVIDKGYENEDIEWQIVVFRKDSTHSFEFYFKKTLDGKWVLFQPRAIYD